MFRKVEIWVLYLVVLIGILFAIGFGVLVRQEIVGDTKLGKIELPTGGGCGGEREDRGGCYTGGD